MDTWITVSLSDSDKFPLAVHFDYDKATVDELRSLDSSVRRYEPLTRTWLLKASQWPVLMAAFGDRLSAEPCVWNFVYPTRRPKARPARQRDIWGGSTRVGQKQKERVRA